MCLSSSSFLFNLDFESLDEMDKIRVYPVGTLQICLELQFHRLNVTNSVCDSAKSVHPRVTTQCQDNFIIALSLRNQTLNACTFSHELRTTAGVNVSDQTIRNHLRKSNLRPRRPAVHIPLTQRHRRLRLEWCRRHLRWPIFSGPLFAFRTNHDSA